MHALGASSSTSDNRDRDSKVGTRGHGPVGGHVPLGVGWTIDVGNEVISSLGIVVILVDAGAVEVVGVVEDVEHPMMTIEIIEHMIKRIKLNVLSVGLFILSTSSINNT